MDIFYLKLCFALIIFLIGFSGGLFPLLLGRHHNSEKWFSYGENFSRGIFIGVGIIHLLPEANNTYHAVYPNSIFPMMQVVCTLTIAIILLFDHLFEKFVSRKIDILPYHLGIVLSIHSLIAGSALGLDTSQTGFLIIFTAIIAHKSSEGFAISINFIKNKLPRSLIKRIILLFSLMTPLGVIFGASLQKIILESKVLEAIFDAIASGTFLYIAGFSQHAHQEKSPKIQELFCFSGGIILMAIVALIT